MIITHIIGGLGNQMFQYAAGRALSSRHDQLLYLDTLDYAKYDLHQGFELERIFSPSVNISTKEDISKLLGWQGHSILKKIAQRTKLKILRSEALIIEPHFQYWSSFCNLSDNCYLVGYWQSEKYFKSIESIIRKDFLFKLPMSTHNQWVADQIMSCNSVSLHVRRGDYVENINNLKIHGVCSLDYYRVAIQHIFDKTKQPHLFIFSDDITWVKYNLKIDLPCLYIDHNRGTESYNDMRLMSLCRHHVIANSSFSWWGAWLNPQPNKIVIAPAQWFNVTNIDSSDLCPVNWLLV